MRVDAAHCLAEPASKARCVVLDERERMMEGFDPRPNCSGRTLVQRMEDRLDEIIWDLMVAGAGSQPVGQLPGQAQGITECIALVRTPYAPDLELVKQAAMVRYYAKVAALSDTPVG